MHLSITKPPWLFARTCAQIDSLLVYKSPLFKETDPIYGPVVELLRRFKHKLVFEEVVIDPQMMFGEALLRIYQFVESLDKENDDPVDPWTTDRGLRELGLLP